METIYTNNTYGVTTKLIKYNNRHYEIIQPEIKTLVIVDNYNDANREYNRVIKEVILNNR